MQEREFNLLSEKWIRAMRPDCSVEECSLREALLRAQEYKRLAGELPTQDVAILRLLEQSRSGEMAFVRKRV